MSDEPTWIAGETYRYEEICAYTFPDHGRGRKVPPDTLFIRHEPEGEWPYFEEFIPNENPLVSGMPAQLAVQQMRAHGLTFRQISRASGVSIEAIHRSASGVGRIRASTDDALVGVASNLNGKNAKGS